jgi:hypothetical protein
VINPLALQISKHFRFLLDQEIPAWRNRATRVFGIKKICGLDFAAILQVQALAAKATALAMRDETDKMPGNVTGIHLCRLVDGDW